MTVDIEQGEEVRKVELDHPDGAGIALVRIDRLERSLAVVTIGCRGYEPWS